MITVIGSINYDITLYGRNFPKKGENIILDNINRSCGGKGENSAIAVSNLYNNCNYIGAIGNDEYGLILKNNLKKYNVNIDYLMQKEGRSGCCYIFVDSAGDNFILVDPGVNEKITEDDIEKIRKIIVDSDIVLIQLEINNNALEKIVKICYENNVRLVIDAGPCKKIDKTIFNYAYIVSPNRTELEYYLEKEIREADLEKYSVEFREKYKIKNLIVKLGERGALLISDDKIKEFRAYKVHAVDSTAAGDSFMAGLVVSLAEGKNIEESIDIGMKCGAICVTRYGAVESLPTKDDIEKFDDIILR